jgi:hypothetical protein
MTETSRRRSRTCGDALVSEREGFQDEGSLVVGRRAKARQTARETRLDAVNQRVAARFEGGTEGHLQGRPAVTVGEEKKTRVEELGGVGEMRGMTWNTLARSKRAGRVERHRHGQRYSRRW